MITTPPKKKIIVLSDGTWCGRDTGTVTNIAMLARMIGIDMEAYFNLATSPPPPTTENNSLTPLQSNYPTLIDEEHNIAARYFDGCGHGGNFLDYLWNGATGADIGKECMEIYEFIATHFDDPINCEVWMFGHSRGSFTVRCVAGMINNCGIIKTRATPEKTRALCEEVYSIYRSPFAEEKPGSPKMLKLREKASWNTVNTDGSVRSAVKFMGLIDTVGSCGVPNINAGVGLDYPTFYDQDVSGEVEKVYHAASMHDRFWAFEPCRARREAGLATARPELAIREKWFPGCHYDVGRQKFRFLRKGQTILEKAAFAIPDLFTQPVEPNGICADLVLLWLLEAVGNEDRDATVIPHNASHTSLLRVRLAASATPENRGSGDVYSSTFNYTPAGIFGSLVHYASVAAVKIADELTPGILLGTMLRDNSALLSILKFVMATRDRRIPDADADVVHLQRGEQVLGGRSVMDAAGMGRYKSRTYENFMEYLAVVA